ncbi:MAG: hypothetical protein ACK53L_20170, partial [Pirellulaceae bacterium]
LEGNTHEGTGQPQPKQTQPKKKRGWPVDGRWMAGGWPVDGRGVAARDSPPRSHLQGRWRSSTHPTVRRSDTHGMGSVPESTHASRAETTFEKF